MKTRMACWWMVVAVICLAGGAPGQVAVPEFDPLGETGGPTVLRVQVEFIETPQEELTKLLREPRQGADDTDLRKALDDLIAKGGAKVLETLMVVSRSGQKSKVESIEEVIYPTEYMAVEVPLEGNKKKEAGEKQSAVRPLGTAFETRNTGSTLEIEPTLGENEQIVDLRLVPEIVYRTGDESWSEWKDALGDASARMPRFYTARLNTATVMQVGKPQMIGAVSPKGADGFPDMARKLMVFVRCDVLKVGK